MYDIIESIDFAKQFKINDWTEKFVEVFKERTLAHIAGVRKYFDILTIDESLASPLLSAYKRDRIDKHDNDKLNDDRVIRLFACKYARTHLNVKFSKEEEVILKSIEKEHRQNSQHHPEYYYDDRTDTCLIGNMSVYYVLEMVADWMSCGECNGNNPLNWALDKFGQKPYCFPESTRKIIIDAIVKCMPEFNRARENGSSLTKYHEVLKGLL